MLASMSIDERIWLAVKQSDFQVAHRLSLLRDVHVLVEQYLSGNEKEELIEVMERALVVLAHHELWASILIERALGLNKKDLKRLKREIEKKRWVVAA